MRQPTNEITALCESWRGKLSASATSEQVRFAERLLALLGWEQPIPFSPRAQSEALGAKPFLLRAGGQNTVVAYFVLPGTLEPPVAVLERGLDFCEATRLLVDEARALNMPFVFVSDFYRAYLYDARTDELLLYAGEPRQFDAEFSPVLGKEDMARGSLEELRRQPRSAVARRLREWCQYWIDKLGTLEHLPEEQGALVIDRLLVIRYLFDHDVLRRTRWQLQQRFGDLSAEASKGRAAGCGERLAKLFHDMWLDWRIDLFAPVPAIDAALSDAVVAPMLREFGLLSRAKFSIATILESFNHGDPSEKMRVRMVPDENVERDSYLAKQSLATIDDARIEVDLMEEGYRAMFFWFDRVTALYERLEVDFDSQAERRAPEHTELDLFVWSEMEANRPEACGDILVHACERGFGVYYSSPRQYRIARLLLTLHLISRYDRSRRYVDRFPSLTNVMMKRPVVLSAERLMRLRPDVEVPEALGGAYLE
jgi:hypothetical protein